MRGELAIGQKDAWKASRGTGVRCHQDTDLACFAAGHAFTR
jgi:hypothetical protein